MDSARGSAGVLEGLKRPKTWGMLLVLLLVGGLWLWGQLDSAESGSAPAAQRPSAGTTTPSTPPAGHSTSGSTARPSAPATARPSTRPTQRFSARPSVPPSARPSAPASRGSSAPGVDRASGLAWIEAGDLPREGREILTAIDNGGPFVRSKDGTTFGNYEGLLPPRSRGYYREYTVPTPGVSHAGARRIITGQDDEFYWTQDHYESFERIRR